MIVSIGFCDRGSGWVSDFVLENPSPVSLSVNQSPSLIGRVGSSIKKDQRSSWTRDHSFPPDFWDEDRGGKAGSKFLEENFTSLIDRVTGSERERT